MTPIIKGIVASGISGGHRAVQDRSHAVRTWHRNLVGANGAAVELGRGRRRRMRDRCVGDVDPDRGRSVTVCLTSFPGDARGGKW